MGSIKKTIRGRAVSKGIGEGKAMLSKGAFMFAHGVEPSTGDVIDVRSDIEGENIRSTVFIFPFGKGSTTGSAWFLETVRKGNGPAAIINRETDPIIVTAVEMARVLYGVDIPIVDRLEEDIEPLVTADTTVRVDGEKGEIAIFE